MDPQDQDFQLLLAAESHLGTKNVNKSMTRYVFKRRVDGVHVFNVGALWQKLMLAARVIVAVENPQDVCVISSRQYGQRAVYKFSQHTGAQFIAGRFTPGTFTNQVQKKYMEPRVLIVTDPILDAQAVREASYVGIPVIAFTNADANLQHVDIAIPCNNKAKNSIAALYWLLTREVLRLRGTIPRSTPWEVAVDLFIFRDPEEEKEKEAEHAAEEIQDYVAPEKIYSAELIEAEAQGGDWLAAQPAATSSWATETAAAPATETSGWN